MALLVCQHGVELLRRQTSYRRVADHNPGTESGQAVGGGEVVRQDGGLQVRRVAPHQVHGFAVSCSCPAGPYEVEGEARGQGHHEGGGQGDGETVRGVGVRVS